MDKFSSIFEEIEKSMYEVPFGNSAFQTVYFGSNHETEARTARQVLLELNEKIKDLKSVEFKRARLEIDIKEINKKLSDLYISSFEKERLMVDLKEKEWNVRQENKLIDDATKTCNLLYSIYKKLPKITREEFELAEFEYWAKRLKNDAHRELKAHGFALPGTLASLEKMGFSVTKNEGGEMVFNLENPPKPFYLEDMRDEKTNDR